MLGNLKLGGTRGNPEDLLIAQRAPSVREVPRNEATGRTVPPTDSTAIWTLARPEDAIAARAQTASGHTDVGGSRLTQGPILDLFSVTDVETEAAGTAVQLTALGSLNFSEGLPLVQLTHEFLGVKGCAL